MVPKREDREKDNFIQGRKKQGWNANRPLCQKPVFLTNQLPTGSSTKNTEFLEEMERTQVHTLSILKSILENILFHVLIALDDLVKGQA